MEHGKYMSEKNGMANCPSCRGVIFRDFRWVPGETSFTMRCPHCQKDIRVIIDEQGVSIQNKEHENKETM